MIQALLKKIFGTKSEREVKMLSGTVAEINRVYETLHDVTDEKLQERTEEFRTMLANQWERIQTEGEKQGLDSVEIKKQQLKAQEKSLNEILPEAFAMVKETCRRMCGSSWMAVGQPIEWEMVPYDVQLIGAIVLHQGKVAEMKTGEGKTLVATMPIYLNALTGRGVHVITVNDYLAQRDAEWMGEIYRRLGLTVGFILNNMDNQVRREEYAKDIIYGTNNEFGFDYLRDNMALAPEDQVQRGHAYAVVDEVDSVLIDEARTPLIISGAVDSPVDQTSQELKPLVQNLVRKQNALVADLVREAEKFIQGGDERAAGLKLLQASRGNPKHRQLQKIFQEPRTKQMAHNVESEYLRDKRMHEVDEDLYFAIEEKTHTIDITDKGRKVLAPNNPETFIIPDIVELLHDVDANENLSDTEKTQEKEKIHQLHAERSSKIHTINQLLRAYTLYEKDVDYVVQDGKVLIVDEFTGRVLPGRRYSDGLHQALEAKENVSIERETQTLATITIQNYFRLYDKLSGMTGTAETEAEELGSIYDLDVTVIPTNVPVIRKDLNDVIYKTKREKYNAVIEEIAECYKKGQPTLVGTVTVEVSELISRMLKRRGIPHNVLNAKHHQREAEIVARAGQRGAVTIATNMAGRGTDIKLGEGIRELGGLHIIGTERHESRRIDLQLRGRCGRQGDPGSTRFYLSLEDDLMRLFGSERIAAVMDRMGLEEGEVITHRMVTRAIENAQKKVEARNFGIRKHLLEYDDVMNQQRQVVYDLRNMSLHGADMKETVQEIMEAFVDEELAQYEDRTPDQWDWDRLRNIISTHMLVDPAPETIAGDKRLDQITLEDVRDFILTEANDMYRVRESMVPEDFMRGFERFIILRTIDEKWKDHLYGMDQLREGINLRAYGQKNPLLEYKSEGFHMFQEMMADMNRETVRRLFRTQIQGITTPTRPRQPQARNIQVQHADSSGMGFQGSSGSNRGQAAQVSRAPIHVEQKIGRNEKVNVISPSGDVITIKYKKLQSYLDRGYRQQ
ncbi:MAG: preprotein translocase subunit SecA [Fidelibacterota bacterium]